MANRLVIEVNSLTNLAQINLCYSMSLLMKTLVILGRGSLEPFLSSLLRKPCYFGIIRRFAKCYQRIGLL